MTLYDTLWPTALGGGLGVSYTFSQVHGTTFWLTLPVGIIAGYYTLRAFDRVGRRLVATNSSETAIVAFYAAMFVCVLAMSAIVPWAVRSMF